MDYLNRKGVEALCKNINKRLELKLSKEDLPGGIGYEETYTGEILIEYDGDSTGKLVVDMREDGILVKVSDLAPEPTELIGAVATVGGESQTITADDIEDGRPLGMPGVAVGGGMLMILYAPIPSYGFTEAGMYIVDMNVPASLKYTGTVTNIHKIAPKYLEFFKISDVPLVDETVSIEDDTEEIGALSQKFFITEGEHYFVEIDRVRHLCVAKSFAIQGMLLTYVGNLKLFGPGTDSGEQFCIASGIVDASLITIKYGRGKDYHIKIHHVDCAKIPKECLPDDIGGLPEVTEEDNGKVLTVSGGKWGVGSALPAVSSSDNGKFLQVVDGAYALVALQDVSKEGM